MKWCDKCKRHFETSGKYCPECGSELMDHMPAPPEPSPLPQAPVQPAAKKKTDAEIQAERAAAYRAAHPDTPVTAYHRSTNSGLFAHPGQQLKTTGKIIFWVIFVIAILLAFITFSKVNLLITVIILGAGFIVAWLFSITTYAFGALLDDVEEIKENLRQTPRT